MYTTLIALFTSKLYRYALLELSLPLLTALRRTWVVTVENLHRNNSINGSIKRDDLRWECMTDIFFDNFEEIISKVLSSATKSVKIAVAWLNFDLYWNDLNKLIDNGIKVKIIINGDYINGRYSNQIELLESKGAFIKALIMPTKYQYMHHKFCIIDNKIALIGSYNWSKNANKNFENLVIIDDELIVNKIYREFKTLEKITTKEIFKLQNLRICSKCDNIIINIMILNIDTDNYNRTEMKNISMCTCGYNEIVTDIIDGQLYFNIQSLIDKYNNIQDNNSSNLNEINLDEWFDFEMENVLVNFFGFQPQIHAIGVHQYEVISKDGDGEWLTRILWKNRFVAKHIENTYYDSFF